MLYQVYKLNLFSPKKNIIESFNSVPKATYDEMGSVINGFANGYSTRL